MGLNISPLFLGLIIMNENNSNDSRPFWEYYGYTRSEWESRQEDFEHMSNLDYALMTTFEGDNFWGKGWYKCDDIKSDTGIELDEGEVNWEEIR